jgi:hypothetical protein
LIPPKAAITAFLHSSAAGFILGMAIPRCLDLSVIAIVAAGPEFHLAGGFVMPERKALLRLSVVLSTICLVVGCSSRKSTDTELVRPVKTVVVAAGNKPNVRSFPGAIEAAKSVDLAFQVPGLLIKEPGKEGEESPKAR